MPRNDILTTELSSHICTMQMVAVNNSATVYKIADLLVSCFKRGNKLLICGNGGSAADAQHIAAEFINRFRIDRPALPAIALTTDSSVLTCIGNDSCFENIYSRQVEALAVKDDILVAISTSGRSKNILNAVEVAHRKAVITIGFTGEGGKEFIGSMCDYCLVVPSNNTARIQECHEFIWHVICGAVEEKLFEL